MEQSEIAALTALGHPGRLAVFRLLARRAPGGVRPGEMAEALGFKANTLSVYLAALQRASLVTSERAGRSVFYRIDLERVGGLIDYLVADCCRGRPELCTPFLARDPVRQDAPTGPGPGSRPAHVLFVCTGNSARSILAEAILARDGGERFRAYSAGTQPRDRPHPAALALLQAHGCDTSALSAKPTSRFRGRGAPRFDFVFTVCDRAANEDCPPWPGRPLSAHWGLPDPVSAAADEDGGASAFFDAYRVLCHRLDSFLAMPFEALDPVSLQATLDAIGHSLPPPVGAPRR